MFSKWLNHAEGISWKPYPYKSLERPTRKAEERDFSRGPIEEKGSQLKFSLMAQPPCRGFQRVLGRRSYEQLDVPLHLNPCVYIVCMCMGMTILLCRTHCRWPVWSCLTGHPPCEKKEGVWLKGQWQAHRRWLGTGEIGTPC